MQANLENYRSYLAHQCLSYFRKRHAEEEVVRRNNRDILNSFFYHGAIHRLFVAGKWPMDRAARARLQKRYKLI